MVEAGPPATPRLYKYRSMEDGKTREYTLAILKTLELRYSPASKFNDPFDCNLGIALRSTAEVERMIDRTVKKAGAALASLAANVMQAARRRLEEKGATLPPPAVGEPPAPAERKASWKVTIRRQDSSGRWRKQKAGAWFNELQGERMTEMYRVLDKSFGVLCLSERPDDILLWSHYGSNHSGLCLEFDVAGHPDVFRRLHRVFYQKPYPAIPAAFPDALEIFRDKATDMVNETLLSVADVLANELSGDVSRLPPEKVAALGLARWFYVKSSFWSYEREWRCLKWEPGPQPFPPKALTRIIAGCTNTDATLALVREAINGTSLQDVPLFKAVRKARKFGLDIVPAE